MRIVRWTRRARADLKSVREFIADDSAHYAEVVTRRLVLAAEVLQEFPEIGRLVPEFERPDTREIIVRPYRVVYRLVDPNEVHILTVHHSARLLRGPL